jgi:hypothetical protein
LKGECMQPTSCLVFLLQAFRYLHAKLSDRNTQVVSTQPFTSPLIDVEFQQQSQEGSVVRHATCGVASLAAHVPVHALVSILAMATSVQQV